MRTSAGCLRCCRLCGAGRDQGVSTWTLLGWQRPPRTCPAATTTLMPAFSKGNGWLGYFFFYCNQYFLQRWGLSGRSHPTAAGVEIFQVVLCYFCTGMVEIGASIRTASPRDMCSSQYRHAFGCGQVWLGHTGTHCSLPPPCKHHAGAPSRLSQQLRALLRTIWHN